MIIKNRYQTIFDRNQFFLKDVVNKSNRWYWAEVDALAKQRLTPSKVINDNSNNAVSKIVPGNLYLWQYDPKTKETLPYYDTAPLVFPFTPAKGGFIGINMHYLPYNMRIILLEELTNYATNKNLDEKTKIRMSWEMLKSLSNNKMVEPCVKRYLYSHIRSKIVKIDAIYWTTAMFMPISRFKKASEIHVWSDTKDRVGR